MKRTLLILAFVMILTGCSPVEKKEPLITQTPTQTPAENVLRDTVSDTIKNLDRTKPHKFVTFSFDDGTIQDKRLAALFDKYGMKCTFNVNTGSVGVKGELKLDAGTVDFTKLTEDEMRETYKNHEVAVHTVSHPDLRKCDDETIIYEVGEDYKNIEKIMNQKVVGMAWPGGPFFNDHIIDVILSNTDVKYSRETTGSNNYNMPNNFMVWKPTCHQGQAASYVNRFIKMQPDEDKLLYIWGHSWEFDLYDSWDNFEKLLKKLSECEDLIFVTNSEIYYYMTAEE